MRSPAADVRWWILAALAAGMIAGDTGHAPLITTVTLTVMMCVSLHGLGFGRSELAGNKKYVLTGIAICYLIAGGITLLIGSFYHHELWLGWVMIAAVPCAISVTSGTLILKGDTKLAVIMVTAIYLTALIVTPLMTGVFIGEAVSPSEVLKYVGLFIIVPFIASVPLRKVAIDPKAKAVSINIMFFILVFITFGANREFILNEPAVVLWVAAGCAVRIGAVAVCMELLLKYMKMKKDRRIPMTLLSIWKNSALAMSMTLILIPSKESVLPAALSLPLEMVCFMIMIWYYEKRCSNDE